MTMDDFTMLTAYWAEHPPVHLFWGARPAKPTKLQNNLAQFLGADMANNEPQTLRL